MRTKESTQTQRARNYGPCPDCGAETEVETNAYGDGAIHTVTCAAGCGVVEEIDGPTENWLNYL